MHAGKYSKNVISTASLSLTSDVNPIDKLGWTTSFESVFGAHSGDEYAISVNSATSGLHAALLAFGVGEGDEVISPALTVVMDSFVTDFVGATPVFADVEPDTWNIDPISVKKLITSKTKAIISVSWLGLPTNLSELRQIADTHGLALIDDSAETILDPADRPNDWNMAHCRVFSFESKKHMPTGGEGGMVTTSDPELATKIRKFAGLGYKHLSATTGRTSLAGARDFQNPDYLRFDTVGFNYRMNSVTAAIGVAQVEELPRLLSLRKLAAEHYLQAIEGCSWLIPQRVPNGVTHSYYTFGIDYLGEIQRGVSWQDFYDRYREMGGDGFYANCMNPYLEPVFRGKKIGNNVMEVGLCPNAEGLQRRLMSFKTNYKNVEDMIYQSNIMSNLIDEIGR